MNQNTRRCRGRASAFPPAQFLALCSTYRLPAPRSHRGAAASVSAQPNRFGTWGPEGGNTLIPLLPPQGVPLPLVPGPPPPLPGTERLPRPVPSHPVPSPALLLQHMADKKIHERVYIYINTHTYICVCVFIYLAPDRVPSTFVVFLQHPFFFIKPQMI